MAASNFPNPQVPRWPRFSRALRNVLTAYTQFESDYLTVIVGHFEIHDRMPAATSAGTQPAGTP